MRLTTSSTLVVPHWFLNEIRTTRALFNVDNFMVNIVAGVMCSISAWSYYHLELTSLPDVIFQAILYFFLYAYMFIASNQLSGIGEDRINKPHRPLVRGLATVQGLRGRLIAVTCGYLALGWHLGVIEWALLWTVVTYLHNQGKLSRIWWCKNLAMFLGIIAMMVGGWQMVAPVITLTWHWALAVAGGQMFLVSVQDLRDIAGDKAARRRTLPIILPEIHVRRILAAGYFFYPLVTYYAIFAPAQFSVEGVLFNVMTTALCWTVSYRTLRFRTPKQDHLTYLVLVWWYCLILLAPAFVWQTLK